MIRRPMTLNLLPPGEVRRRPPSLTVTEPVSVELVRATYRNARRWGCSPRHARNEVLAVHFIHWTVT